MCLREIKDMVKDKVGWIVVSVSKSIREEMCECE